MPKIKYSREVILKEAIKLASQDGIEALNVRSVASELGCSVAPIYTAYGNFESLQDEVIAFYREKLKKYINKNYSSNEFLNMGIGLVDFTIKYPNVFMSLFKLSRDFDRIVSAEDNLMDMMRESHLSQFLDEDELRYLLDSMSYYSQGLCVSIIMKPGSISLREAIEKLDQVGSDLITATLERKSMLDKYFEFCKTGGCN